jgi:hypothetical protein
VKEGFAWGGFIAPLLWLLYNRLWRDFFLFILVNTAIIILVQLAGGNATAVGWATALVNLAFGFEARNIHRAALGRRGYTLIGVVTGRDLEDAERRFLSEWLPGAAPQAKAAEPPSPEPAMTAGMAHG